MCRFGSATAPHHRRCDRDRADDDHRCAAIIESALVAEVSRIVPYIRPPFATAITDPVAARVPAPEITRSVNVRAAG
jgi:hypothetical protein